MQLQRLEIKGFKSFGDKVVVRFDEGITGVVGPNGCGKSNIIDAMRWVLGEHRTKNLRSDKMSNIIFNGTAKRKAADLAEVSLYFNNNKKLLPPEYTEVCITRRYMRNGTSEYLLNGTPCRRKDISNLLLNTGATSNSYAIIELKMVDDILTDREDARKVMFEEAAGVAQFKIRKKETLAKLEATQSDLERVEDLLHEIIKNMNGLERQAKQAEKYFSTKEAYQKFSIALAKRQVKSNANEFATLNDQINQVRTQKEELTKLQEQLEQSIETQKQQTEEQEKWIAEKRRYLQSQIQKITEIKNERQRNQDRIEFLSKNRIQLEEQIGQDQVGTQDTNKSLASLQNLIRDLENSFTQSQEELTAFQSTTTEERIKTDALRNALQAAHEKFKTLQNDILMLKKEIELKENQQNASKKDSEQMALDFSGQADELAQTEGKLKSISHTLEDKNLQLEAAEKTENERIQKLSSLQNHLSSLKEKTSTLQRKESSLRAEYNLTKSLLQNMEGYSKAMQFLSKQTSWSDKAVLLADIFTVSAEYRLALEAVLEPFLNFYVVPTQEEAQAAIRLLSEAKVGKANFFVLEKLETFVPALPTIDGAVAALAVVKFEKSYKKLAYSLLHNVYFSENNNPNAVDGFTIVLKNGELLMRSTGAWTGGRGADEQSNSQLGRKQRLQELQKELQGIEKELAVLEIQIKDTQQHVLELENQSQKEVLRQLQKECTLLQQQRISLAAKAEQMQQHARRNEDRKKAVLEHLGELTKQIDKLRPQLEEKEQLAITAQQEYQLLKEKFEIQNNRFEELSQELQQKQLQAVEKRNQIQNLKQEIEFKNTNLLTGKERIEQAQKQLEQIASEISEIKEKIEDQNEEIRNLEEVKEAAQEQLGEIENEFYKAREELTRIEKNIKEIQRQRENCDTRTMSLQNKLNETKLKLTATKERLSAEFEIELNDELLDTQTEEDALSDETLIDEIEAAKRRLQRIGTINATAKEAYDEIKKRHDFITEQRSDLLDAQKLLQDTIAELDQAAKDAFLNAFHQIRENFIRVFRSLFSEEDNCDLLLTNPEDPLESKIEILAQPKGKRPLTIKQLSGGEKTLTAVALLFALYLLRPAPFCIFDEVDAPLDDANIDKFTRIIKKFSEEVQFIIVTHNKRTMVSTDVVYGVTMPEVGVSKVLPVDLKGVLVE